MRAATLLERPWRRPEAVLSAFADEPWACAFLSGGAGDHARWSYLLRRPDATLTLAADDPRGQRQDPRYARLDPAQIPLTECLKDTVARVLPCWNERLAPALRSGQRVLVAAHGNSMRALVKYLDGISDSDIVGVNIPNGIPLVYELDEALRPVRHYYLGDPEAAAKAAAAVARQGKA